MLFDTENPLPSAPSQPHSSQQFPHSPLVFFPFQSVPAGRIHNQNQTVLFKIEAFPEGIITCTGQKRELFQGDFRAEIWQNQDAI